MQIKLTKPLTTVLTVLVLISCFTALYNVGLTSADNYENYTLYLTSTEGGTTSPSPGTYSYAANADLKIVATPDADHYFAGWDINGVYFSGISNTINGQMDRNYVLKAYFSENPYTLTVITNGQGTVSPGNSTYNGQTIDLQATPADGWSFAGWGGDATGTTNTTITMNSNKTVTATFALDIPPTCTLTVYTIGQGDVNIGNVAVNTGNKTVPYGTSFYLTATPAKGWSFAGWTGDATGTEDAAFIHMDSNKTVTATFTQKTYTLTVVTVGNGTVTPNNQTYTYGQQATLTAIAASGWTFSGWSGDTTGTTASTTITMNSDKTVTATFRKDDTYPVQVVAGNITQTQFTEMTITEYQAAHFSVFNFSVSGPSGTSGTATIAIPIALIDTIASRGSLGYVYFYIDGVLHNNDWTYTCDDINYYITFNLHFSTHEISIEFREAEPTPTPTETPAPTDEPTTTPAPTTEPTTNPTTTPTATPAPTAHPTNTPTTSPTGTPAPTISPTTQPTTTQPTTTNDLTLPIAGIIALLAVVIAGLVVKNRKHKW